MPACVAFVRGLVHVWPREAAQPSHFTPLHRLTDIKIRSYYLCLLGTQVILFTSALFSSKSRVTYQLSRMLKYLFNEYLLSTCSEDTV